VIYINNKKIRYKITNETIPGKEYPDTLQVREMYADGVKLLAVYSTGELFDDAVQITIGWKELAEVCALVIAGLSEENSKQFYQLIVQRQTEIEKTKVE
jgi:hypothetical protein